MTDNREPGPDIFTDALNLDAEPESTNREPGADVTAEETPEEAPELELTLDEEAEETPPEKHAIKAYGETHELTVDELKDYAQKYLSGDKQEKKLLADHEARRSEIAQERKQIEAEAERLGELLEVFGQSEKAKEHLEFLAENDYPEWKRQKAMLDEVAEKAKTFKESRVKAEIEQGVELLATEFPQDWADTQKRSELLVNGSKMLLSVGIEPNSLSDGRVMLLAIKAKQSADKAQKYDDLVEKAKQAKTAPPKKLPSASSISAKSGKADEYDVVANAFAPR